MSRKSAFENLSHTPAFGDGFTMYDVLKASLQRSKEKEPLQRLPSVKTDLKNYYSKEASVIWFGHSSYLVHADGKNILVDPVLSGAASPVSCFIKAFNGSDIYKTADMPAIDYLVLTHNHYDHLDYKTLKALAPSVSRWVIPAGVRNDLNGISIAADAFNEMSWWDTVTLEKDITITSTPARHFSGRGLKRNGSLWNSYVLDISGHRIFMGGDSGYDSHFREIGEKFGPFDLALLECGQYDKMWPYIHSMPEEVVTEARELKAKMVMPVHWGKFALANHDWHEPIQRFVAAATEDICYATPMIGEPVVIGKNCPQSAWWRSVMTQPVEETPAVVLSPEIRST
jgi:L-ascorbate metabolism protein UlaG (beta-lactamase superfamily)